MRAEESVPEELERDIITYMITDVEFLSEICPLITPKTFKLPFASIVAKWICDYFDKFKKAPGNLIQTIYNTATIPDSNLKEMVRMFLVSISDFYEEESDNSAFLADKAEKYIRRRSLENTVEQLQQALALNQIEAGEAIIKKYERVARPTSIGVDPFTDHEAVRKAFESKSGMLVLPGAIGKALGPFQREHFVGMVALQKRGKSWWLQKIALSALFAGFSVLFVTLEMSEGQMIQRTFQTLCALPTIGESDFKKVTVPVFDCGKNQNNTCMNPLRENQVELGEDNYSPCSLCRNTADYELVLYKTLYTKKYLSEGDAIRKAMHLSKGLRGRKFKLIQFPDGSLSPLQLEMHLHNWEHYDKFIPDFVVIDYADKMVSDDLRDGWVRQQEMVWKALKALAQRRRCCVVTASQSNTAKRQNREIGAGNNQGTQEKESLVDFFFAINQSDQEKDLGMSRVKVTAHRHRPFNASKEFIVLQSLDIGQPFLDSMVLWTS